MLRVKSHSVIAFTLSNAISSDHLVRCWINDRKNVLVLEVDVDLACNWIVLRHPRFAVEMQRLDDLVLLHIDDSLRLAALVGNIKFVKRSGVRAAIRLSLRGQLLDDLHLFQIGRASCRDSVLVYVVTGLYIH